MAEGKSRREAALLLGTAESTLRGWIPEWIPGAQQTLEEAGFVAGADGSAVATSDPVKGKVPSPIDILESHGLDIDEWEVISVRASRWGNPEDPMIQLRVNAIRKDALIAHPVIELPAAPPVGIEKMDMDKSFIYISDQHCPYMDKGWERAVCGYIKAEQPQLIVCGGDAGDLSEISRHRTHPRFAATVNATNDAVVRHLANIRLAAGPECVIIYIPGNHDDRIAYYAADFANKLSGVRPGQLPGEEVEIPQLNYRKLWCLDELGIELVDEDWKLAQYLITEELAARHGYLTGNNSERKLLEKHGRSQIHGHDHRLSATYRTKHDPLDIRAAFSAGCGAELKPDGLGYEPDPDWQNGAVIGHVWDDGLFAAAPVPYVKDHLLLPDGRKFSGLEE